MSIYYSSDFWMLKGVKYQQRGHSAIDNGASDSGVAYDRNYMGWVQDATKYFLFFFLLHGISTLRKMIGCTVAFMPRLS